MRVYLAFFLAMGVTACRDESGRPLPNFERMMDQRAYRTWEGNKFFADGRNMRTPPRGTVPRDATVDDGPASTGLLNGAPITTIPISIDHSRIARGRADFEVYCATCHGIAGDGNSRVAAKMELRRPPSLVAEPARSFPPGRVYRVIINGYGLMRSYAEDLPTSDRRWGVVAYLQALQISRETRLDDLPADVRDKANEALR